MDAATFERFVGGTARGAVFCTAALPWHSQRYPGIQRAAGASKMRRATYLKRGETESVAVDSEELEQLLQRCARRDGAALQALYQRSAPQLLGILMRMLGSRAAAEDALQDTFISIWQQAAQYERIKGRAMSWMVTIARNRAIDMQRATRPTVLLDAAEIAGAEQLRVAPASDGTEFGATQAALQRAWACSMPCSASACCSLINAD